MFLKSCITRYAFSTEQAVAQKTYVKFNQPYTANLEEFKKKVNSTSNQGEAVKRSTQRAYVHPLHTS